MSNNLIQNFEEASGRSFTEVSTEAGEMMASAYDEDYDYEEYYEACSELVQNFLAGLAGVGLNYPELNQVSSFVVEQFFNP